MNNNTFDFQKVSFVIPCYHSEKTLAAVVKEIDDTMSSCGRYSWEIVMVNDGSADGTWDEIQRLCEEKAGREGICFSRNFGQHAALMAGIRKAQGEVIVCLDDDGQTPADEATKLLDALKAGADVVYASYDKKQHSGFRNFGTRMNEEMCRIMLDKPKDLMVTSYFAMRRFIADEVIRYENSYPYLVGLVLRTTRNIVNVPVTHRKREAGRSGYTFSKLLGLWLNGFTAFSIKPLRIATAMGGVFAGLGFIYAVYTVIKKIINPAVPVGFSALMTAILVIGGMLMAMLGMVGEYVGRTYIGENRAPQYVIRQQTGRSEAQQPDAQDDLPGGAVIVKTRTVC